MRITFRLRYEVSLPLHLDLASNTRDDQAWNVQQQLEILHNVRQPFRAAPGWREHRDATLSSQSVSINLAFINDQLATCAGRDSIHSR